MDFLAQNLAIFSGLIFLAYFSWQKIEYGIYLIVFFLPVYLVRLNIFGLPSTALELGIYILCAIWLIKNYRVFIYSNTPSNSPYKGEKKKEIPYKGEEKNEIPPLIGDVRRGIIQQRLSLAKEEKNLIIGILLLFAGAIISTVFSSDLKISAGILKGWFFDPLLFFIILASEIKTLKQKENILKALFFSGATVASISLLYLIFFDLNGLSYDGRLHGFYLSPNYLSMYISPALIIGIWLFFLSLRGDHDERSHSCGRSAASGQSQIFQHKHGIAAPTLRLGLAMTNKYLFFLLMFIMSLAIYFTYSYAAWLAIFFTITGLFYFMAKFEKKLSFHWKLSFLSIFLVLIVLFFNQNGTSKFENLKNLSYHSSYNSRLMIWRSAWAIGRDNWLIGIGPGNFQKYYLDYQTRFIEPYLEWAAPEPHNIFLAFWLETGILGLLGFIIILIWFFKKCLSLSHLSLRGDLVSGQSDEVMPAADPPKADNLLPRFEIAAHPSVARNDRNDRENYLLIVVLFSIMIYTIIHGLFDTTYWKNDLAVIFWLNLALLIPAEK